MSNESAQNRGFVQELQRRHVVRTAVAYAAVVFVLLQLGEIILPAFFTASESDALIRLLVVGAVLFSPIVLLIAWVYEITPMGVRSMAELDEEEGHGATGQSLTHRLAFLVVTVLAMGGAGTWWWSTGDMPDVAGLRSAGVFQGVRSLSADGPIGSLAVMPLEDLAAEPGQEYFAPGMHEALISELSGISTLRVASRTSVVQYDQTGKQPNQIGSELGVDALVTGSVLRADGRARISAQLIHAASGTQLWSETYVRDLEDIIALQRDVAQAVAAQIFRRLEEREGSGGAGERLAGADPNAPAASAAVGGEAGRRTPVSMPGGSEGEPAEESAAAAVEERARSGPPDTATPNPSGTSDLPVRTAPPIPAEEEAQITTSLGGASASYPMISAEAQETLMQGRMVLLEHGGDPEQARVYFQKVLEEDSTFAPAMAGLAGSILIQGIEAADPAQLEAARTQALTALGIDPDSPDALAVLEGVDAALVAVRGIAQGQEMEGFTVDLPSSSMAQWIQGRVADLEMRGGAENPGAALRSFSRLLASGDLDAAESLGEDLLEDGVDELYLWEAMEQIHRIQQEAGDLLELREERSEVRGREPGPTLRDLYFRVEESGEAGYWSWKLEELNARLEGGQEVFWFPLASARLAAGDTGGAFSALNRAVEGREPMGVLLRRDPHWDERRSDPRMQQLMRTARQRRPPVRGTRSPGG